MVIAIPLDSGESIFNVVLSRRIPVSFLAVVFNVYQKQFKSKKVQMSLL